MTCAFLVWSNNNGWFLKLKRNDWHDTPNRPNGANFNDLNIFKAFNILQTRIKICYAILWLYKRNERSNSCSRGKRVHLRIRKYKFSIQLYKLYTFMHV